MYDNVSISLAKRVQMEEAYCAMDPDRYKLGRVETGETENKDFVADVDGLDYEGPGLRDLVAAGTRSVKMVTVRSVTYRRDDFFLCLRELDDSMGGFPPVCRIKGILVPMGQLQRGAAVALLCEHFENEPGWGDVDDPLLGSFMGHHVHWLQGPHYDAKRPDMHCYPLTAYESGRKAAASRLRGAEAVAASSGLGDLVVVRHHIMPYA